MIDEHSIRSYPDGETPVCAASGVYDQIGQELLACTGRPRRALIITDEDTALVAGMRCAASLVSAGFKVSDYALPHDEDICTIGNAAQLLQALMNEGLCAADIVIGIGDCPVLSLAGALAAIALGGTNLVLVPTTPAACMRAGTATNIVVTDDGRFAAVARKRPFVLLYDPECPGLSLEDWRNACAQLIQLGCMGGAAVSAQVADVLRGLLYTRSEDVVLLTQTGISLAESLLLPQTFMPDSASAQNLLLPFGSTFASALSRMQQRHGNLPGVSAADGPDCSRHLFAGDLLAEGLRFEAALAGTCAGYSACEIQLLDDMLCMAGFPLRHMNVDPDLLLTCLREPDVRPRGTQYLMLPHAYGGMEPVRMTSDLLEHAVDAYCSQRACTD